MFLPPRLRRRAQGVDMNRRLVLLSLIFCISVTASVALAQDGWDVVLIDSSYPNTVTEDGVTGYEYVYDVLTDGSSGRYLGFEGFDGSQCAWIRTHPVYGETGMWQTWGNLAAGHNVWYSWGWISFMTELGAPSIDDGTGASWAPGIDMYGDFVAPGQPFPWAINNIWHTPDEYNWGYEIYAPTVTYVPLTNGLSWDGIWGMSSFGQDPGIMLTIRIVHPNPPGEMFWSSDAGYQGWSIGPTGELDTEPPIIESVTADPAVLKPANHKMVLVTLDVVATDNVDDAPVSSIIGVTVSEETSCKGNTNDAIGTIDGLTVELKAERSGKGTGRTYTVTVECIDASGNSSTADVQIVVPHDKGKKHKKKHHKGKGRPHPGKSLPPRHKCHRSKDPGDSRKGPGPVAS